MTSFSQKIRLIYLPFLLIDIAFIVVYSALNWWMFMQNDFWGVQEYMSIAILPLILPWIPALLILRPRVNLLDLRTRKRKSLLAFYLMVSTYAMAATTIIAQMYLLTATGKLTVLNSINEINNQPLTKFYTIKSHYIDKMAFKVRRIYSISGKYGETRNRDIYIVSPIYDDDMAPVKIGTLKTATAELEAAKPKEKIYMVDGSFSDSITVGLIPKDSITSFVILTKSKAVKRFGNAGVNGAVIIKTNSLEQFTIPPPPIQYPNPVAWLGVHYHDHVSNRASYDELKASSDAFYEASFEQFKDSNLEVFTYLDRIGNNDNRTGYIKAVMGGTLAKGTDLPIILEPRFNDFTERNGYKLAWTLGSFAIGAIVFLLMLIKPKFKELAQE